MKPPGTLQAFQSTPSRFGGGPLAPDSPAVHHPAGVMGSHPVEVVGRVRQHPEGLHESSMQVLDGRKIRVKTDQGTREFSLDGVSLAQKEDLLEFYSKYVEARVDDVKGGGRCTVMMYGPTGAGKSYTMFGSNSEKGIAYLALRNIMDPNTYGPHGCGPVSVRASIIEIYNEEIFDLLAATTITPGLPKNTMIPRAKLEVMGRKLKGQTWINGSEHNKLFLEISKTEKRRVIKSTNCNDRSSRSHCVVILEVPAVGGRLVLVDMAGSENVEQAGIGAEARYQTGKINQGNGALKRVVEAIANGHDHIPYRDSKLTMILQASFEDDGARILMILCASPDPKDMYKTLGTLEYGAKAKCILRLPTTPPKDKGTSGLESELIAKVQFKDACIQKLRQTQEEKDRAIQEKEQVLLEKEEETRRLRLQIAELERRKSIGSDQQFEMKLKLDQLRKDMEQELEKRLQGELEKKLQETREFSEQEGRRKVEELELELQRQQMAIDHMRVRAEQAERQLQMLRATPELFDSALSFTLLSPKSRYSHPDGEVTGAAERGFSVKEELALDNVSPSSISLVSRAKRRALEGSESENVATTTDKLDICDSMSDDGNPSGSPEYDRRSPSEHDTSDGDEDDEALTTLPRLEGCMSPAIPENSFRGDMIARLMQRPSPHLGDVDSGSEQMLSTPKQTIPSPYRRHELQDAQFSSEDTFAEDTKSQVLNTGPCTPKHEQGDIDGELFTWSGSLSTKGYLPVIHEEQEEDDDTSNTGESRTTQMSATTDVKAGANDSLFREPLFPSNLNRDKFLTMVGQSSQSYYGSHRSPHVVGSQDCHSVGRTDLPTGKKQEYGEEVRTTSDVSATSVASPGDRNESSGALDAEQWNTSGTWRTDSGWRDVSSTTTDRIRGAVESRGALVKEEVESSDWRTPGSEQLALGSIVDGLHNLCLRSEVKREAAGKEKPGAAATVGHNELDLMEEATGDSSQVGVKVGTPTSRSTIVRDDNTAIESEPRSLDALLRSEDSRRGAVVEGDTVALLDRTPSSSDRSGSGDKRTVAANRRARIESIFLLCGERRERKELATRVCSNEGGKSSEESQGLLSEDELRTPRGNEEGKRLPSSVESKSSRVSQLKASPKPCSPSNLDYQSPVLRTASKGLGTSPGPSPVGVPASPTSSPLKGSPLKSKRLLSLPANLFKLPGKGGDHKTSLSTPGSFKGKQDRFSSDQCVGTGSSSSTQKVEVENNENELKSAPVEVFVKWEAAKDSSRKLVHMVSISKAATLADLRREIEPHVPEAKREFSFLFLNGDPSGAPVDRSMESVLRVASLPDCNNNRSSRLACLRPPAKAAAAPYRGIFPFQTLENKLDLDRPGKPGSGAKNSTKLAGAKSGNWAGPPVAPQIKGLRTLATGFGIRPGNTLRERANTAHVTEEVAKYLRQ